MLTSIVRTGAIHPSKISRLFFGNLQQKATIALTCQNLNEPPIPTYERTSTETIQIKRARLLYQSRKRGMLENDLLLSTFAGKYLASMNDQLLEEYDRLINLPSNDWEIYYWATGAKPVPDEFNNKIMSMLKDHVLNSKREDRTRQPDLNTT